MINKTYIYALVDPRDNKIRYVGKANNPKERYKNHINPSRDKNTHKRNWLNLVRSLGYKPELLILDHVDIKEWRFWEIFYIDLFKSYGFELVNHTIGGDGASYGNQTSYKKGMIPHNKGVPMSEESKNKIRDKLRGIPNISCRKPILKLDKDYNIIEKYESIEDATRSSNGYYLDSKISLCCRGLRDTHRGFIWIYDDGRIIEKKEKKKKRKKGRGVEKYTVDMVLIERFDSIKMASESAGVSSSCILNVIKGKRKKTGNYIWKYEK